MLPEGGTVDKETTGSMKDGTRGYQGKTKQKKKKRGIGGVPSVSMLSLS